MLNAQRDRHFVHMVRLPRIAGATRFADRVLSRAGVSVPANRLFYGQAPTKLGVKPTWI